MKTERDLREVVAQATGGPANGLGLDDDLVLKLGLDSLAGLRLLAMVEKRFDVRFPDRELGSYRTLRRILDAIQWCREEGGKP